MDISIITICKDNLDGIKKTIKSVDEQISKRFEHIVIDGDSTDGTKEYVFDNPKSYRKVISEPDSGISNAFNKGLCLASGKYVVFLNSGDTFTDNLVIEEVFNDINNDGIDIYTYVGMIGGHTVPEKTEAKYAEEYWTLGKLPHQATFVRRDVFDRIGTFDESLRLRMDYDFFYRCSKANLSYKYIPRVIVNYEDGGACISNLEQFALEGCIVQKRYEGRLGKQSVDELISIYLSNNKDLKIVKMYDLMERIAISQNSGYSIGYRLLKRGIEKVAIYGKGRLGKTIYSILMASGISVDYFIDRFLSDEDCYSFDYAWPTVDSIIICTVDGVDDIKEDIESKVHIPVLSIEEILD